MAEQPPYVVSVAYHRPNRAKAVYRQVEALLYDAPVDLSAYNLLIDGRPTVIVLGNPPPAEVHEAVMRCLGSGQPVVVPEPVLATLYARSQAEWQKGPWRADHHGAGTRLRVDDEE